MAIINESAVQKALLDRLGAIVGLPFIVPDGAKYTPVVGTPYVREKDYPAITQAPTLGVDGYQRRDGSYRVGLFYPKKIAKLNILAIADIVKGGFPRGLFLTSAGQKVEIKATNLGTMYIEGEWKVIDMMINYTVISP